MPARVERADDRAHRGAHHEVGADPPGLERGDGPDVGQPLRAAPGEHQRHPPRPAGALGVQGGGGGEEGGGEEEAGRHESRVAGDESPEG